MVKKIRTVCPQHCGIDACGIMAHLEGGRIVKLEPADFPDPRDKRICLRGLSSLDITYHPDRLKYPMKRCGERGEGKFERISWDEAFDTIAAKFKDIAGRYGWKSIGWVLGGPGAGTTKFGAYLRLASLTRSTRVSAWGYGDAGLPCGSRLIFGSQFPYLYLFGVFWQRRYPELLVIWGSNPAETMPLQTMRKVMDAKEQGTQVIVIDPRFTVTASKADQYVGIVPGTDGALTLCLVNEIFKNGHHEKKFIQKETNGAYLVRIDNGKFLRGRDAGQKKQDAYMLWIEEDNTYSRVKRSKLKKASITGTFEVNGIECKPAFQMLLDLASQYSPGKTEEITSVPRELIKKLARRIGEAKNVIFYLHMGLTRTYHGHHSLRGVASVASITGNVTTSFDSGSFPAVLNWDPFLKAVPGEPSFHRIGILNLYDAVIKGKPYPIKAAWFAFTNFLNQCVDCSKIINEFFPKLEFIVCPELFMTPTAKYADLVLPVCSFLEFSDCIPHPYPYVQLQQKVIDPLYESKSDVDIVCGIADRLGYSEYFEGGEEGLIDLIMDHPSLKDMSREKLKDSAIQLRSIPPGSDFPLNFSTPSGKIELYSEMLVEDGEALPVYLDPIETPVKQSRGKYPLSFIQGHSRFRTHSSFGNVKSLLSMNPEPLVELHPADARKRGIENNSIVKVFNDRGETIIKARLSEGVHPGTINITEGWWMDQFTKGSVNHLTHDIINPIQEKIYEPNMHMNDVAVEVERYTGAEK